MRKVLYERQQLKWHGQFSEHLGVKGIQQMGREGTLSWDITMGWLLNLADLHFNNVLKVKIMYCDSISWTQKMFLNI